jgi:hypothetical protein
MMAHLTKAYEAQDLRGDPAALHTVTVVWDEGTTHERRAGLRLRKEVGAAYPISPTGHSWGYGGSGPAQLALDLLWDVYDQEPDRSLLQAFKWDRIATLDGAAGWRMTEAEIRSWVESNGGFRAAQAW